MFTLREFKRINNPSRYLGGESGIVTKNSESIRVCIASPDIYEHSMSNLTVLDIYNKINSITNVWCERVFAPMPDFENLIRKECKKICTLESNTPINEMNIIIFVIDDVMQYTNVLNLLNMGGIPILKERRDGRQPIIVFAGKEVLNPVPLNDFADLFLIGEAEEIVWDVITAYSEFRNLEKQEIVSKLSNIRGVYIGGGKIVEYVMAEELEYTPYDYCIVPSILNELDINITKVSRGCDMPHLICQDKYIYPKVEEKVNSIYEFKDKLAKTGERNVIIDCKHMWNLESLKDIIYEVQRDSTFKRGNINFINVKFNKDNLWALDYIKEGDVPTILVSGAIKNVQRVIGYDTKKEEILNVAKNIFRAGFSNIKLVYVIGTPKENYEDLNQVITLANEIANIYFSLCPNTTKTKIVDVELIPFTAYPHTPLEWCKINSPDNLELKIRYIMDKNNSECINIKTHDTYRSCIKQMLLRGDKTVSKIVYDAWKNGAKLDNNEDMFCREPWQIAIQKNKVGLKDYLNEINTKNELPWDNIIIQTPKEKLKEIYERGINSK